VPAVVLHTTVLVVDYFFLLWFFFVNVVIKCPAVLSFVISCRVVMLYNDDFKMLHFVNKLY